MASSCRSPLVRENPCQLDGWRYATWTSTSERLNADATKENGESGRFEYRVRQTRGDVIGREKDGREASWAVVMRARCRPLSGGLTLRVGSLGGLCPEEASDERAPHRLS
jgi:hypothetical protein